MKEALLAAEQDLVLGEAKRLSPDQARLLRIAPWCYLASKTASACRRELAVDFSQYARMQQLRAQALVGLFKAWQNVGIQAIAIKGLAMAYTVYDHPAGRFCGDTDLLLSLGDAERARRLVTSG